MWLNEGCSIIITEGIYKDRHGKIEIVSDAKCCYGVKVEFKEGDGILPPTVWYREGQIRKEGE